MHATEHLEDRAWTHPECYGGFSPDGDYVIVTRHRDSDTLDESNFARVGEALREAAKPYSPPDDEHDSPREDWVYEWRAGHWAVGWVDYLMVRHDAPDEIRTEAGEIVCALADYPVFDENDYSEREHSETLDRWERMSLRERIEHCAECGASIFAARDETPCDTVYDWLREQ